MKKIRIILFLGLGLFAFNSCETTDLDLIDNPNNLTPNQADVNFFMNDIQINFARNVIRFGEFGSELTRIDQMFGGGGNYQTAYDDVNYNTVWSVSYQRIIQDIRTMNPLAEELEFNKHIAVGQVIEAYLMMTLVDFFGDVPYSEAFDPLNLDPAVDSGASVYAAALDLLDQALVNFDSETPGPGLGTDFYYNNNFEKWAKLANTLKMKAYIQTRLVDGGAVAAFEQIVTSGNYITANADNFVFNFGTQNQNPDSRHPGYVAAYQVTGTSGYQSNWLMDVMKNDKSIADPRIRYYFYRQRNSVPVSFELIRCSVEPIPAHYANCGATYCIIDNAEGYWGRDHGNREGIPPDARLKTARGLYPVGGRFDDNTFQGINNISRGALGQGIAPVVLASSVDFWRAEASLFGGSGNATAHVASGVDKSISYVKTFISRDATANTAFVPPASETATYIAEVTANMNGAASSADRLDQIGKEFFISLYGNGIDAYNFYRRTGAPRNIQPHLEPNPGGFIRSHFYPANAANNNANINQKPGVTQRVFWDTNPESGFPIVCGN